MGQGLQHVVFVVVVYKMKTWKEDFLVIFCTTRYGIQTQG